MCLHLDVFLQEGNNFVFPIVCEIIMDNSGAL